ncbi:5'(3')-deoxyribonucleotidase, cytosolic type isoform X1 [Aplysia californica]|uniref:5'(3')-deoxyribonucleotidase, cytosolic type isoform X1 n=1 Tax=Aplysia californica TaxID=6500 RepID=A0ABM0JV89_APLCA|nr:5'(3')-deoxyribonucleotidase, cytosolic type isoform X1 [Aplysia californica]
MAGKNSFRNHSERKLLVLVDMDQVLCDFEMRLLQEFQSRHPNDPFIPLEERRTFYARDQYAKIRADLADNIRDIYNSEGFFRDLPEIPGACDAMKELKEMEGVDVFICSSPLTSYEFCLKEKFQWIEEHLGQEWLDKIILTKDKTVANGHVLIDDRPNIKGAIRKPIWEHVVFTACHNVHSDIRGKRRLDNWTDGSWRDLILDLQMRV